MGERKLIVDHLKFSYDGLFNVDELYSVISTWFFEKGWDWTERLNQEQITPQGKQIRIILEPWKSSSDFYKLWMKIKLHMNNVRDVDVEHEGQMLKLSHGQIAMIIDGWVMSDRFGVWSDTPLKWFFKTLAEKYFYHDHFHKFEIWLESDVDDLHNKIKGYLNVFKYTYRT